MIEDTTTSESGIQTIEVKTVKELEDVLLEMDTYIIRIDFNGKILRFTKESRDDATFYIQRSENDVYGMTFFNGVWIHSYPHLKNIKDSTKFSLESSYLEEKVNGCLSYGVLIDTDEGKIPIGKIVNNKMNLNVLSYNFNKRVTEYKPILGFHKEKSNGFTALRVNTKYKGSGGIKIVCTENHKFHTPKGWIEARDLKVDDVVFQYDKNLDYIRKQFILGGLLGDSSVKWGAYNKNCGFVFSHSIVQSSYFDLKIKILGNLCSEGKGSIGGFEGSKPNRRAHSVINKQISDFIKEHCLVLNKRTVTKKWAEELSFIGIAIWYMDDGFLVSNGKQRDRAGFSASSYSKEEIELIQVNLLKRLGMNSTRTNAGILVVDADTSEKLFALISPYIIDDMQYKLPEKYRNGVSYWENYTTENDNTIIPVKVKSINEDYFKADTDVNQYDIEVADNENYFANNLLVHNTHISIGTYNTPDGENLDIIRTRMAPFPDEFPVTAFWNSNIDKMVRKDISKAILDMRNEMITKYPDWFVVAGDGEYVGLKVQEVVRSLIDVNKILGNFHAFDFHFELVGKINPVIIDSEFEFGKYNFDAKLILLDVFKKNSREFMTRELKEQIANDLGLELVPVKFRFDTTENLRLAIDSIRSEAEVHKIEGYVIKNGVEMVKLKPLTILQSAYRLNAIMKGHIYGPDLVDYIGKIVNMDSLSKPEEFDNLVDLVANEALADYAEELVSKNTGRIRKILANEMALLVAVQILEERDFASKDELFRYLNTEIPKRFEPLKSYIDFDAEKSTTDKALAKRMKRRRKDLMRKITKYCLKNWAI